MLTEDAENFEALGELEKLYEREKAWGELGEVLQRQVAIADDDTKRAALLTKLGILYTEKVQDTGRAIAAWQALLAAEPENRRAQDALKKLYLQQRDWNALEGFYAAQGKWDELVRVLERQSETEEDPAARVGLWNKIGELYRDRLSKADRAQKAFEKALSLDAQNAVAALALIPLYEKTKDVRRLAEVLAVQLHHTTDAAERQAQMQRLAELLEGEAADKAGALAIALQAFDDDPLGEWAQTTSRRLAAECGGWPQLVEAYEAALPRVRARSKDAKASSRCCRRWRAPTRASWPTPRRRSSAIKRSWRSRPAIPRRWARWSGSTSPPGGSPTCWRSTTRSSSWPSRRPRSWRSASSWPACTKRRSASPRRRSSSTRRS